MEDFRVIITLVEKTFFNEAGVNVKILKKIPSDSNPNNFLYIKIFNQIATPFQIIDIMEQSDSNIIMTEITDTLHLNKFTVDNKNNDFTKSKQNIEKTETSVSRGYCLTIPNLGDLIITHSGNVICNIYDKNEQSPEKISLYIEAPQQVCLDTTGAKFLDLNIFSSSAVVRGNCTVYLHELKFTSNLNSEMSNGLFIDDKSKLLLTNLHLLNSMLVVFGELKVSNNFIFDGGQIFNIGHIKMLKSTGQNCTFNITYFFNASEKEFCHEGAVLINTQILSNLGKISINNGQINVRKVFNNQGLLNPVSKLEIIGEGESVNNGTIESEKGRFIINNRFFVHKKGTIKLTDFICNSKLTVIESTLNCTNATFRNKTINQSCILARDLFISGHFINNGSIKSIESICLIDDKAEIQNSNDKIETGKIISNAKEAVIKLNSIKVDKLIINGQFMSNVKYPVLDTIEVGPEGEIEIDEKSKISKLKTIKNSGKLKITSSVPSLELIETDPSSYIYLESKTPNSKVKSLKNIKGYADINIRFIQLRELEISSGSSFNLMSGSSLLLTKVIVHENAEMILRNNSINKNSCFSIYNFGEIKYLTSTLSLSSIYNGQKAKLLLLEDVIVTGKKIEDTDLSFFNMDKFPNEEKFWVLNEGTITVMPVKGNEYSKPIKENEKNIILSVPNEIDEEKLKSMIIKGIKIYNNGKYLATETAILGLNISSALNSFDMINYGKIYCPQRILIDQIGHITRYGIIISEAGIDMNVYHEPLLLNGTFQAVINGNDKTMNINCSKYIEVTEKNCFFADLYLYTTHFYCNGILSTKSFILNSNDFLINKSSNDEKNVVSANDTFEINTTFFMNDGGTLQSLSEKPSKLKIIGIFKNTGGGEFSKDHQSIKWYSKDQYGNLTQNITTLSDFMYTVNMEKSGLITAGGPLEIEVGDFDNSFGVINGNQGLTLKSSHRIVNECGMIYSGGKMSIKGEDMDNGFVINSSNKIVGLNPNQPIFQKRRVLSSYRYIHQENSDLSITCQSWRYRDIDFLVGYQANINYARASKFRGYIFSKGDMDIKLNKPSYIGVIVSEKNIKFQGKSQLSCDNSDLGKIIAGGNLEVELKNVNLDELDIQAKNVLIKLIGDLTIRGILKPVQDENKHCYMVIDLAKLSTYLGFTVNLKAIQQESSKNSNSTSLTKNVSLYSIINDNDNDNEITVFNTFDAGFIGTGPKESHFMSIIKKSVLDQLVRLTLTPIMGRDVLLHIDIINELKKEGASVADSISHSQNIVLKEGKPALMFKEIKNQEVEMEIDGEAVKVPLCNPYLIIDSFQRLVSKIRAEQMLHIQTDGDIHVKSTYNNFECQDLTLETTEKIEISSQFKYSNVPERLYDSSSGYSYRLEKFTEFKQTELSVPGNLNLLGDKGVTTKAAHISAKNICVKSKEGDIVDLAMTLDPVYRNRTEHWGKVTTTYQGGSVNILSMNADVTQNGTNIVAGDGGVTIKANKYRMNAEREHDYYNTVEGAKIISSTTKTPKQYGIISSGNVTFMTKDSTLVGATIVSPNVSCLVDGDFRFLPAYIDQHNWAYESHSNFFGSSSVSFSQDRRIPVGCQILAGEFNFLGAGTLEMEGVVAKIVNATITKNIEERAAYETSHTVITQSASGFCPPKIQGDCFVEAIKNASSQFTCFEDALPCCLNLASGIFQTMKHLDLLRNLSTLNPVTTIAEIFLSRFVTSFTFMDVETKTTIDTKIPHQSQIDIEVLKVSNDRTHLEGIINVEKKATIETGEFTTYAPQIEEHQHTETHGFSISISPVAVFGACIQPSALAAAACLPTVGISSSEGDIKEKKNLPQILTADDLFIRCDNAVFRGSTIEARLVEMIVSGDLTIEDLRSEFESTSSSSNFSVSLDGLFKAVSSMVSFDSPDFSKNEANKAFGIKDESLYHPAMAGIPHIRIADEKTIQKKVQKLASLVGREKFILKVGRALHKKSALVGLVPPDGIVTKDNEVIEAAQIFDEQIEETYFHEKNVFNPCLAEFVGVLSSYNDWKQTEKYIEKCKFEKYLKEQLDNVMAKKLAEHDTKKLKKDVDETNMEELVMWTEIGEALNLDLDSALSDEGNSENSQSTPDSKESKTAASNTNASTSKTSASKTTSSASKATSSASNATSSASNATSSASKTTSSASKTTSSTSKATSSTSKATSSASNATSSASNATSSASNATSSASKTTSSASKTSTPTSKENSSTTKTNANESTADSSASKENLSALRKSGMTAEQEANIKAHVYAKIQEKRRQCERDNAFNGKSIKESVMNAISERKKNNWESFMEHVVNIDNKVKKFQEEHPNICNVLEAATDAVSTAVEGLSLGTIILMTCENPYAGAAAVLAYGVKCAVESCIKSLVEKGGIKFVMDHTKDESLKKNFEKSAYHLIGIVDRAISVTGAKNLKKSTIKHLEVAGEHGTLSNGMKSKLFAAKMNMELDKPSMKLNKKSTMNAAAESFNHQNIPDSHIYNMNKGTTGKTSYIDPSAPKVDPRNQAKFYKPEAPEVEYPFRTTPGSMLGATSYEIPDSFFAPHSQQNDQNNQNNDFQNTFNLFAPSTAQQNNQNNGFQNTFNLFAPPPVQQSNQNGLNNLNIQNNGVQNQFNLFAPPPVQQNGQNNQNNASPNTFMTFGDFSKK